MDGVKSAAAVVITPQVRVVDSTATACDLDECQRSVALSDSSFEEAHRVREVEERRALKMPDDVLCVAIDPAGKHVAVGMIDSTIKIFFLDSLEGVEPGLLEKAQQFLSGWLKKEAVSKKFRWFAPKYLNFTAVTDIIFSVGYP